MVMEKSNAIAVVTATYNRKNLLPRLYESLRQQSLQKFSWVIVDDGSTDGTWEYVNSIQDSDVDIIYFKTENGGKCRALNKVFKNYPQFMLYLVVDSDDCLMLNALETVNNLMLQYQNNKRIGGIFFRYINTETKQVILGKKQYPSEQIILSRLEHDKIYGKYDGCIAYYNRAVQKYQYPEFEGEKYVGPIVLQLLMEPEFKLVFTTNVIGVAEYQQNGISKAGRILRLKNPLGMMLYCGLLQKTSSTVIKMKYAISAQAYRRISGKTYKELNKLNISKNIFRKYALPGGCVLAVYWKYRYKKTK